jgi:hypothetical protein
MGGTAGGQGCGNGKGNRIDERRPLGSCGYERVDFFLIPLKKGQQTSRQTCNFGDTKRHNKGNSEKSKSVNQNTKKSTDEQADKQTADFIFGDTLEE